MYIRAPSTKYSVAGAGAAITPTAAAACGGLMPRYPRGYLGSWKANWAGGPTHMSSSCERVPGAPTERRNPMLTRARNTTRHTHTDTHTHTLTGWLALSLALLCSALPAARAPGRGQIIKHLPYPPPPPPPAPPGPPPPSAPGCCPTSCFVAHRQLYTHLITTVRGVCVSLFLHPPRRRRRVAAAAARATRPCHSIKYKNRARLFLRSSDRAPQFHYHGLPLPLASKGRESSRQPAPHHCRCRSPPTETSSQVCSSSRDLVPVGSSSSSSVAPSPLSATWAREKNTEEKDTTNPVRVRPFSQGNSSASDVFNNTCDAKQPYHHLSPSVARPERRDPLNLTPPHSSLSCRHSSSGRHHVQE